MKKALPVLLLLALLLGGTPSWSKPVDAGQARKAAVTLLNGIGCKHADQVADRSADLPFRNFYLFAAAEGGFALIAADDCVVPVLGYSATSRFDSERLPAHVADWLGGYEEQIAYFAGLEQQREASGLSTSDPADAAVEQQWHMLLNGQMPPAVQNTTVAPMLTTTWNQSPLYNNLCPADNGHSSGHAVAGCTAIATAQVMKYWNHPSTGHGSYAYSHDTYGTLSANFGTTAYQWTSMPDSLTSTSTTAQINAVATLVYHVGVAAGMNYGITGSGARTINYGDLDQPSAENALKYYFKYQSTLRSISRADYTPAQFATLLTAELTSGRPIIFTGYDVSAGHAFVLDGVNNSGDYHVNWGWGGYCDGYYTMGALNPSDGGIGGNTSGTYNMSNSAIIGIQPSSAFSTGGTTTVSAGSASSALGTVTGSGTYYFGDTVTITANAAAGYRFAQWSDGDRHNPRRFLATGGSHSFTASFAPLQGDTLGYAPSETWVTNFGGSGDAYWGIKLPASALTAGDQLKSVQLVIAGAGSYTVSIYAGSLSNTPTTQSFTATTGEVGAWKTIQLLNPVNVIGNQDIWITFHNTDVLYPAALTYDGGSDNGMLWGSAYTSIRGSWHYTYLIRGIFGPNSIINGDTLSYCGNDPYQATIGAGGTLYWGIKLPSSLLTGRQYVSAVQIYITYPGTYQMTLSQGGTTAPGTTLLTQNATYSAADTGSWKTITLSTPVAINSAQPLWITFYNSGTTYPASASAGIADTNGSYVSLGNGWTSLYTAAGGSMNYTWMIRCITSSTPPTPSVTLSGPTQFANHTAQTFTATCNIANATYTWTLPGASSITGTGNTRTAEWASAGTYSIIVAATANGTTVRDTLQVTVYSCDIATFPHTADFSSGSLGCWSALDADGDGYCWETALGASFTGSASYILNYGALAPDNWLISPSIVLPQNAVIRLSWNDKGQMQGYSMEHYTVYLSTTGDNPSDFTTQLYTGYTADNWATRTASLAAYAGQTVRIAFRHHNSSWQSYLLIDSITLAPYTAYTITATANNPAYGTVTGGGTYASGQQITLTATPATGHEFVQWQDGDTHAVRTITVTGNASYVATFQPCSYTLTVSANDPACGTVTGGGTYAYGQQATLTATPATGYEFAQWQDGDTHAVRTVTVTGNASYVATFQTRLFVISVTANDPLGGSVTGSGTYAYLAPVTATATPYSGYVFAGWSNGESYNPYTFPATQDMELQAIFTPINGIGQAAGSSWSAFAAGHEVVVLHAAQRQVRVYDISGRLAAAADKAADEQRFAVSHGGIYFVVVDAEPARKVAVF